MNKTPFPKTQKGQVLVIVAVSFVALLIFVGLAIDGTQLFLNYTRLKRAVDSAAVAAANDFRKGVSLDRMRQSAIEVLDMQQVRGAVNLDIFRCDNDGDGETDPELLTTVPDFPEQFPKTGQTQKKLIYVWALEQSPTNFVTLIGIHSIPITTNAIVEAAPVDLVIVLDTSMSMGNLTSGFNDINGQPNPNFSPAACNTANNCQPLRDAKDAAKVLIDSLYPGYDRVAIVTFDTVAQVRYSLGDPTGAPAVLDNNVPLHDDPSPTKLSATWDNYGNNFGYFNPINPEDRDNNGADLDTGTASTVCQITNDLGTPEPVIGSTPQAGARWDYSKPNGGIPCDGPSGVFNDGFDWNGDGFFKTYADASGNCPNPGSPAADDDHCLSKKWMADHNPLGLNPAPPIAMVSTCTGCGIRLATSQLTQTGRTNAVWVMVFMTDGVANMSDTPQTAPYNGNVGSGTPTPVVKVGVDSAYFPNGYCGGFIQVGNNPTPDPNKPNYWKTYCQDETNQRRCINDNAASCPPGATPVGKTTGYSKYSVLDYAKDMTDAAALQTSSNSNEKILGNNIAIYTIMFGNALANKGAPLLRYMAAVGDDGDRQTDPCASETDSTHACGQYYFAGDATALTRVFRDIASRIYTKISE